VKLTKGLLAAVVYLVVSSAAAHHGATVFDRKASIEKSGTVTRFIYRNPHLIINMEVKGPDGKLELWKIEGQSVAALTATGFNRDSVNKGDVITVKMRPLKSGKPGGLLQGLVASDGSSFSMDSSQVAEKYKKQDRARQVAPSLVKYVPPPAGETWQVREKKTRPSQLPIVSKGQSAGDDAATGTSSGALDPENLARARAPAAFDMTGVWQYRGEDELRANYGSYEFKPTPQLTPEAEAYYDLYKEKAITGVRFGDPATQCYPAGMPRIMTRYGSLMMLQYPTAVFMISRLSNEYRVIYLDGRARLADSNLDRNWGGESLGYWQGDTLVVETTGFTDENHLIQAGIKSGKKLKIIERYRMINDNNTLVMELTMTDPDHWIGEWKHVKFRDRVLRSDVKEATCIYTDNLSLPG
jgi:hypothetical protein